MDSGATRQPRRRCQRCEHQGRDRSFFASHEHQHPRHEARERERAAEVVVADGISHHLAGVQRRQPGDQLPRCPGRKAFGPIVEHEVLCRGVLARGHQVQQDEKCAGDERVIEDKGNPHAEIARLPHAGRKVRSRRRRRRRPSGRKRQCTMDRPRPGPVASVDSLDSATSRPPATPARATP